MRGLNLPVGWQDAVPWTFLAEHLKEKCPWRFLEYIVTGSEQRPRVHVIVPTIFGVKRTGDRTRMLAEIWSLLHFNKMQIDVLIKQEQCNGYCAKCFAALPVHEDAVYQMCLRVMSGCHVLFSYLCHKCQIWPNLIRFDETNCYIFHHAFIAFGDCFVRDDSLDGALKFLQKLNRKREIILHTIPRSCWVCNGPGDTENDGLYACKEHESCQFLCKKRLVYTKILFYIDRETSSLCSVHCSSTKTADLSPTM